MLDWNKLVKLGRVVELNPPTAADITQRIQLARIVADESRIPGLRPGRRYQILYEAAYRWSELVLRAEGWRTKGEGHHEALFSALRYFLGPKSDQIARFLDRCRRRRNIVTYGVESPPVTEAQVERLMKAVEELDMLVIKWLMEKHPELAPK